MAHCSLMALESLVLKDKQHKLVCITIGLGSIEATKPPPPREGRKPRNLSPLQSWLYTPPRPCIPGNPGRQTGSQPCWEGATPSCPRQYQQSHWETVSTACHDACPLRGTPHLGSMPATQMQAGEASSHDVALRWTRPAELSLQGPLLPTHARQTRATQGTSTILSTWHQDPVLTRLAACEVLQGPRCRSDPRSHSATEPSEERAANAPGWEGLAARSVTAATCP